MTVRDLYGEGEGRRVRFEKDAPVNEFSDWLLLTLGAETFLARFPVSVKPMAEDVSAFG